MHRPSATSLSPREQVALDHLNTGLSNQQIADAMGVSVNTIKAHLKNIFRKLETSSRAQTFAQTQSLPECLAFCEEEKAFAEIGRHRMLQSLLDGLRAGATNKQLARTLTRSPDTIKFHLKGIYRQLGARNRIQTMALLIERSTLALDEASIPKVPDRQGLDCAPGPCFLQSQ